ncbi:hypothetical protein SAMN05660748_3588 [Blastococcus aggregatus]|uniref:Uncharacterized protein n=1 Tax=Blastococcus aggregatus TaxID=38502 RepID=A0A285V9T7_9ACTN|nr:hypothetical protein [Blastococcus aggregatus]SOC50829.1 hypothetical protein SAMN05660748_3588 [Blastococcus aggregatus]
MSGTESADVGACDLCGVAIGDVDWGADELRVEVSREEDGELRFWVADFCTQEHAAEWLRRPLPEADDPSPGQQPSPWRDRLETSGCFAVFAVVLVLLALGGWTAARLLLDWF